MNRILYVILGVVFVIFLGLTGYYFYRTGGLPNPISQLATNVSAIPWTDAKNKAVSDCKKQNFPNDDPSSEYISKLLKAAGSDISYDAKSQTFTSPGRSIFEVKGVNNCYFIWLGSPSTSNIGKLVYESKSGEIKQIPVNGYQTTVAPPTNEPAETPSPEAAP